MTIPRHSAQKPLAILPSMAKSLLLRFFAKASLEKTIRVCAKKSEISGRNVDRFPKRPPKRSAGAPFYSERFPSMMALQGANCSVVTEQFVFRLPGIPGAPSLMGGAKARPERLFK